MKLTRMVYLLFVILISFALLIISGCAKEKEKETAAGEGSPQPSIQSGGTYRVPLMNNPTSLDPAYVQDNYGISVVHQLFDGLVRFDRYLTVLPALAETWQVEDEGKTYRFVLRENARFHNGRKVTSEDVIFSIGRLLRIDPPPVLLPHLLKIRGASDYRNNITDRVRGLEPISDREFRVRLEEPHVPFLTALGMYQASIVPKEEASRLGQRFGQHPVGSGPFKFVSWEKNRSIRLERFSDYYSGENALLDGVDYRVYPGGSLESVLRDFKEGKLEEMPVYGKIRNELSTQSGLQWFHRPSLKLLFYGVTENHPLLEKAEIRRALSLAIDRDKLVKEVYKGQFEPAWAPLPPGMPGYRHRSPSAAENMAKARELVENSLPEAIRSLPPIEIVSGSQSSFAQAELNFINESWGRLNIPLTIKYVKDWETFEAYIKSDSVQIYRYAWAADMPDPDSFLHPLFASDSPINYMRYHSKEVDRMLQTARGIIDPVKRVEMYQRIEDIIIESTPLIPLFYLSVDRVYQPYVQNIQVSALGAHTMPLYRVWLNKTPAPQ